MIRNCFHFNPAGTPVNLAGIELQRLFDDKWKNLPQAKPQPAYDDDMDVEDDDSEEDNQHRTFLFLSVPFPTLSDPSRHRRDGETNRGHARHHLCSETTEEGKAAEEGSSSTSNAYRFILQQARKGYRLFLKEGDHYEEVRQEECCCPRRRRRFDL